MVFRWIWKKMKPETEVQDLPSVQPDRAMPRNQAPEVGGVEKPDLVQASAKAIQSLSKADVYKAHNQSRGENPGSFVTRQAETELRDHMLNPGIAVVSLHGPSKQGKSTIIRNVFDDDQTYLKYEVGASVSPTDMYAALLNAAAAKVVTSESLEQSGNMSIGIPIFSAGGAASIEIGKTVVQGSLNDADWVSRTLAIATPIRTIIVDNFHHFDQNEQAALAKDFTVFASKGFKLIAAGTWKQGNYLVERNSDLSLQHAHVSVHPWSQDELRSVARMGAKNLGLFLPKPQVRTLANGAKGSVAALQLICQRFYLDQISKDQSYRTPRLDARANTAVQRVARDAAKDMSDTLLRISNWGATDDTKRSHVSYVAEVFIRASRDEFERGLSLDEIMEGVSKCITEWEAVTRNQIKCPEKRDLANKVKSGWINHQIAEQNTPTFSWDRTVERLTVNDAMLSFVHNTNRNLLLQHYVEGLKERSVY